MSMFQRATKHEAKLRLAIIGPSGSGKTYTALAIASAMGGPIAVVDTENGSASKYADLFEFDVAEMHAPFSVDKYLLAIREAQAAGYKTIILDSASHAWMGTGGILDFVDEAAKRMKSANTFAAWKEGTPLYNNLVNSIVESDIHVIATMRSKTEYVVETNERGKQAPRKVGMAPVQRDGFEYEFDILLDMDMENNAIVAKSRCPQLSGRVFAKPGADVASILTEWLSGTSAPEPPTSTRSQNGTEPATETKQPEAQPTDEQCNKFIAWARRQEHDPDTGPCSDEQYGYLAGVIDGITGQTTHKDVLSLLLGREINHTSVPASNVVSKLLDWLPATYGVEKTANEHYNAAYVACIRKLHEKVMEERGQHKLIEEA